MSSPVQLRALIRNDEALVDHLAPWVAELAFGNEEEVALAHAIGARLQVVGLRLLAREAELARITAPLVLEHGISTHVCP